MIGGPPEDAGCFIIRIAPPSWFALPTTATQRDRQNLSIRTIECLAESGIEPSVGSVGGSYDRANGRH